jgi:hypothetical protein
MKGLAVRVVCTSANLPLLSSGLRCYSHQENAVDLYSALAFAINMWLIYLYCLAVTLKVVMRKISFREDMEMFHLNLHLQNMETGHSWRCIYHLR